MLYHSGSVPIIRPVWWVRLQFDHAVIGAYRMKVGVVAIAWGIVGGFSRAFTFLIARWPEWERFPWQSHADRCHDHRMKLRLIESRKSNLNTYTESCNGRLRDECLNENWFMNLHHDRVPIEAWSRAYNVGGPKKALSG